jgi:hypothetical protein
MPSNIIFVLMYHRHKLLDLIHITSIVLISLWLFLFAAQPKKFFSDGLKKLEQRSHKCVELTGEYVV